MCDRFASRLPLKKAAEDSGTDLPSHQIRPGTSVPDWSVVHSAEAREALLGVMATGVFEQWRDFAPTEDHVRTALLRLYMEQGHAPDTAAIASRASLSQVAIRVVVGLLQRRDLVVFDATGERIVGAYPFTDHDTGHRVTLGDRTVNAMCAVDALGIGAMAGGNATIASHCSGCGEPIQIDTCGQGRDLAEIQPSSSVVWLSTAYDGCCAAGSLCTVTNFFCTDDHLAAWQQSRSADEPGFRLSIEQALEVARAIFGPSLADVDTTSRPEAAA